MDQNVSRPSNGLPHNAPETIVQSRILIHHVIEIDPMKSGIFNQGIYDANRLNILTGFDVTSWTGYIYIEINRVFRKLFDWINNCFIMS